MKKEVILVPRDKCPFDVIEEMSERISNSWIFLHENAYQYLLKSEGASSFIKNYKNANSEAVIVWETKNKNLAVEIPQINGWGKITDINTEEIYYMMPVDPKDIYFLKMDE